MMDTRKLTNDNMQLTIVNGNEHNLSTVIRQLSTCILKTNKENNH